MSQDRYFYGDAEHQERGPYSAAQMRALAMNGTLTLDTPVYQSGSTEWLTLAAFPELLSEPLSTPPSKPPAEILATKERRRSNSVGSVLQVLGVLAMLCGAVTPLAFLLGIVLLVGGSVIVTRWHCTHCGNEVSAQTALCPSCGANVSLRRPKTTTT